jgi:hypothetical protein
MCDDSRPDGAARPAETIWRNPGRWGMRRRPGVACPLRESREPVRGRVRSGSNNSREQNVIADSGKGNRRRDPLSRAGLGPHPSAAADEPHLLSAE